MTHETPLTRTLEQLVHTAAEAPDDPWTMRVLASAVTDLERAAGASLGATEHDPLVVLHRRLGRVHGLLVVAPGTASPDLVKAHLRALRGQGPTPVSVPVGDPARLTLAHAC